MKTNSRHAEDADKTPTGQCPLCYGANPYTISSCAECNYPLPWAKAKMHEREPYGMCDKCYTENLYSTMNCSACGTFLPWAYAISTAAEAQSLWGQRLVAPASPAANPIVPVQTIRYSGDNSLTALDGRNQFVDAMSFLCPALGFVAYVSLLGRLPNQAINAAKYAFYGSCLWFPALLILFVRSR